MCKHVLLELILSIEPLAAHGTVERSPVHHPMLDQIRPGGEALVTQSTRVGTVAEVQVLVLHEYVLVAKTPIADGALVRLFTDVRQSNVADQTVLVAELLVAQCTLESTVHRCRRLGQKRQFGGRDLR